MPGQRLWDGGSGGCGAVPELGKCGVVPELRACDISWETDRLDSWENREFVVFSGKKKILLKFPGSLWGRQRCQEPNAPKPHSLGADRAQGLV